MLIIAHTQTTCSLCSVMFTVQERQFTIIKELLSNDQKIGMLNEDEKKSLAFLKDQGRKSSLGTS